MTFDEALRWARTHKGERWDYVSESMPTGRIANLRPVGACSVGGQTIGQVLVQAPAEREHAGTWLEITGSLHKLGEKVELVDSSTAGDIVFNTESRLFSVFTEYLQPHIPIPATNLMHYPHSCPKCNAPAYVGVVPGSVDCSKKCGFAG